MIFKSTNSMQSALLIASLCCVFIISQATLQPRRPDPHWPPRSTGPTFPRPPKDEIFRFRREANPQGSISLEGSQPLSGPNRKPSIDLNYNQRVFQDKRGHVDAYGGANYYSGKLTPHAGVKLERNYNNGFIGGYGQVQPGPRGRPDPSFGIRGGFRF